MESGVRVLRLLLLLLLLLAAQCVRVGEAAMKQAAVTVSTCAALSSAIQDPSNNPISIPAGTTIDVTTCPDSQLPPFTRPTTVQGAGWPLPIITGRNKTKIFTATASALGPYNVTLSRLVLANGMSNYNAGEEGGCFWIQDRSQCNTLVDTVTFANCTAASGGAMSVRNAVATVRNCTFQNNLAIGPSTSASGGALLSYGSNQPLSITGSRFVGNRATATQGGGAYGGAVQSDGNTLISDSSFASNQIFSSTGDAGGGAIYNDRGFSPDRVDLTILRCSFTANQAKSPVCCQARGGAIHVPQGAISSSSFTLNACGSAQQWAFGGAVYTSAVAVTNCSFSNNTASAGTSYAAAGGSIRITTEGLPTPIPSNFTLCSFTNNTAQGTQAYGGAISAVFALTLASSSFTTNTALNTLPLGTYSPRGSHGGAISAEDVLSASQCVFTANSITTAVSGAYGGAIQSWSQPLFLVGCSFTGNSIRSTSTVEFAGGAAAWAPTVFVSSSSFTRNSINCPGTGGWGGALYVTYSVSALNSSFTNNSVLAGAQSANGGAIVVDVGYASVSASTNFTFCTFSGNSAKGVNAYGGAVRTSYTTSIYGTIFQMNSAVSSAGNTFKDGTGLAQGGAYNIWRNGYQWGLQTLVSNSVFIRNTVDGTNGVFGGAAYSEFDYSDSAGVYANNSATLRFSACSQNCPTRASGGAVWQAGGTLLMSGSSLSYNTASSVPSDGAGGAVALTQQDSPASFTSCTFLGNIASSGCTRGCDQANGGGGAVWSSHQLTIQNCIFSYNAAMSKGISNFATGGAVRARPLQGVPLLFSASSFLGNSVASLASGQANGGAVTLQVIDWQQQATLSACFFANNSASGLVAGGGALSSFQGFLNISSCSFSFNSVSSSASLAYGGAVDSHNSPDPVSVFSSSFSSNSAASQAGGNAAGGALYFGSSGGWINGYLTLLRTTFNRNTAVSDYALGGAVVVGQGASSLSGALASCTFEGNSVVGMAGAGGAVAALSNALVTFCNSNVFGKKAKNVAVEVVGGAATKNDLDAAGGTAKFCPTVSVYNDANSNFMAALDCSSCDCGLFNPCHAQATCQFTPSSLPFCRCPANTRGNGFNCGPVTVCT